jgi:hypothetical protein
MQTARDAVRKLERYAYVRDRITDHDMRTITLTDDEAIAILDHINELRQDG